MDKCEKIVRILVRAGAKRVVKDLVSCYGEIGRDV